MVYFSIGMTCSFAVCQAWNLNHTCIGQSFILISLFYSRQQNRSLEFLSAAERWSGWVIPGRKRSTTRQGEFARIRIGNDQRKHSKDHFVDWKWPFSGKGLLQEEAWQLGRCIPTIWSGLALWRYFSMIVRSIYHLFREILTPDFSGGYFVQTSTCHHQKSTSALPAVHPV